MTITNQKNNLFQIDFYDRIIINKEFNAIHSNVFRSISCVIYASVNLIQDTIDVQMRQGENYDI